jgi:hypothetical protein
MNIPDHISESLKTIFGLKIRKLFYADPDPGTGIFLTLVPGSEMEKVWVRDIYPGSVTLSACLQNQSLVKR